MIDLTTLTITKAHEALKSGEYTVRDLVSAYQQVIAEKNPEINAYISVWDNIDDQIDAAQQRFTDGTATLLTGIPFGIKDLIQVAGRTTTAGSKILEHYTATYSASVIEKLQKENIIILGKTNTDEFAQGSSTENSAYGVTKNPHDVTRVPGGTSGGSSAALAGGMALAALGTDTGGSIRQPSSFCGTVGLKPTYGATSRYGVVAAASSLEGPGPMAKTVSDVEIIFNAMKGVDPLDSTTIEGDISSDVKTIGVPRAFTHREGIDPDVLETFDTALKQLADCGYTIVDIDLPSLDYALATYYVINAAEISSNMARYDGIKFGERVDADTLGEQYARTRGQMLGPEVKRRIMLGTYVLSAGYADEFYYKAQQMRSTIKKDFEKAYENVDIIAMPVAPSPAFKIGEKTTDPLTMYLEDIFTVVANVVGVPAISIPSGTVDRDGVSLPVGLQLLAPHLGEKRLFEVGKKFEHEVQ